MAGPSTAAPGELETVRGFVNTLDVEDGIDALADPAALARWLRDRSLLDAAATVSVGDVGRAVALREALREALRANHDRAPMPAGVLAALNDVAARAELAVELGPAGRWVARPRAGGVDGALGALLVLVADAVADGSWTRLKVCANDACQWGFYDRSRARTGRWCTMRLCGNRAKQQAWRARDRDPVSPA